MPAANIGWGNAALSLVKNAAIVTAVVAATVVGGEAIYSADISSDPGAQKLGDAVTSELSGFWESTGKEALNASWQFIREASHAAAGFAYEVVGFIKDTIVDISNGIGETFFEQTPNTDNAFSEVIESAADAADQAIQSDTGKVVAGAAGVGAGVYGANQALDSACKGGHAARVMAQRAAAQAMRPQKG